MRVEKKSEKRRIASKGVRVEKECKLRRSETIEGVRVEKEGE